MKKYLRTGLVVVTTAAITFLGVRFLDYKAQAEDLTERNAKLHDLLSQSHMEMTSITLTLARENITYDPTSGSSVPALTYEVVVPEGRMHKK